jgi:hypothetical protein
MKIKALATMPTAFLAGAGGTLGLQAFEKWAYEHSIRFTSSLNVMLYLGLFIAPFVLFVVGIDPQRWQQNYAFSREFQAEYPKLLIRWAVYFLATIIVAYAF